ncbi:vacuolar protein sorting-associated protein hydrophilic protein [Scheffersomyces stipitis CBS 6054]|uniref:Vacuolar protein sorting-associated protein 27 n=1 Tax=Scheffersomyces stipitis (strain ATCC 58785 / CBS 6054 / NBRC 10063 / NRRL Y-11545) TaxID=322104 RepID=VPS27_PICST|nr:vacuolar protein sorting-associated protein hydrophilic protein [Scheffersomyces stipitis CBS 6054]A3LX75.2 RecName: Full=Vacuolar protein sorting-associated protein 27 [Scheffersomyces stipitis CBS 6054]ABN67754.2 vacuolar protein sorting-associated protein hydrophilic protein [Scheffersomyces stipitis CBS 6054]
MSWFGSSSDSTIELDNKIQEATSESIPNGELDLPLALEVTDLIRSKSLPPIQCMRSLKKRLGMTYSNPNLLSSTLKLVDLCIKNCGSHFLNEIASKEFMDYLVDFIFKVHYDTKNYQVRNSEAKMNVGELILSLIKEWSILFSNSSDLSYVTRCFERLESEAYNFPDFAETSALNSKFVDTEVPPDWVDDDKCMICYDKFSMINRKHHCRACGGVFCQTHSSNFIPLVSLGISKPVRACDNCLAKQKSKNKPSQHNSSSHSRGTSRVQEDDEDEMLRKAIELSLQDTQIPVSAPVARDAPTNSSQTKTITDEDDDEDLKAAIAASMKDYQDQERLREEQQKQWQQEQEEKHHQEEQSDFYNYSIPKPSNYSQQLPYVQSVASLTEEEEADINKFITLMYQVKNDQNISYARLHDEKLTDLHTKVCPLRSKVTKNLIYTVERQKAFTELNNKIAAITRLYEEHLDSKLKQTYGYQQSVPPVQLPEINDYMRGPQSNYEQSIPAQGTGYQQQAGYVHPETTGYPSYPGGQQPIPQQPIAQQPSGSRPSAQQAQKAPEQKHEQQQTSVPTFAYPPQESYPPEGEDDEEQSNFELPPLPNQAQNDFSYPPTQSYDSPSEPMYPNDSTDQQYNVYPPNGAGSEESKDEYSSGELQPVQPTREHVLRTRSSELPPHAVEQASARFPPIDTVEEEYQNSNNSSVPYPDVSFPIAPTQNLQPQQEPPKKFVPEPEPLIDI